MTTPSSLSQSTAPRPGLPPPYPTKKTSPRSSGALSKGTITPLEELQQLLDFYDDLGQSLDTLSRVVERHLTNLAAGSSRPMHARISRFIAGIRRDFLDGDGDAMEAFLIHRIAVSHLIVQICMNRAAEFVSDEELRHREQEVENAKQRQRDFLWAFRQYRLVRAVGSGDGSPDDITAFEDGEGFCVP